MSATLEHLTGTLNAAAAKSPFSLENEAAYQAWRKRKLALRRRLPAERVFEIDPGMDFDPELRDAIRLQLDAHSFAVFELRDALDEDAFLAFNRRFGLRRVESGPGEDSGSVAALRALDQGDARARYIPYTNRALNWHTDGYYNPAERRINAFALYCVSQAEHGGRNFLFDHELMYLLIRDREPGLLHALMAVDMMHIPANVERGRVLRAEESGPVFSIRPDDGGLNMRYTSRPRHILWKSDRRSRRALDLVREILLDGEAAVKLRLRPGQGLVCNNVLHGREGFRDLEDRPSRLVYRARYLDCIDLGRAPSAARG